MNCPFHLSPRFSLLSFTFLLSLPLESSSEFPSEEQVIAHPPSLPFLPLLLPPLPASLGLSLCLCKAFLSVPITCPSSSLLSPSPLSVQWLHERSAVWSQARLVEEVKAEVGAQLRRFSPFLSLSSSHLQGVADSLQEKRSEWKYCTCLI